MTVGKKIKEFRKSSKLNQQRLAEKAGISRTYLSDVENDRYMPSIPLLKKIAEALAGAGGIIRVDENMIYQNTSLELRHIIYTSLMEAAGYLEEKSPAQNLSEKIDKIKSDLYDLQNLRSHVEEQFFLMMNNTHLTDNNCEILSLNHNKELSSIDNEIYQKNKELEILEHKKKFINDYKYNKEIQSSNNFSVNSKKQNVDIEKLLLDDILYDNITFKGKNISKNERLKILQIINLVIEE